MFRTKWPRCAACTKSKRKCSLAPDASSCEACVKRGLQCVLDPVKIINYKGPKKSEKRAHVEVMKKEKVTNSSLVYMLSDATEHSHSTSAMDHERNADNFLVSLSPKVYLPRQTLSYSTNGPNERPILIDETVERVFDDEITVPKNFSLSSFVLSSLRVRTIKQLQHQEFKVLPAKNMMGQEEIGEVLSKKGYKISYPNSKNLHQDTSPPTFHSFEQVKFSMNTNLIQNTYYIQDPGVHLTKDNSIQIINVSSIIDQNLAEKLFNKFCEIEMQQPDTPDPDTVPALQICLPLVFGNVTALESAIVLAYYWSDDPEVKQYINAIEALHLHILNEFQRRLNHTLSLCCDHTLLILFYLLQIEIIKGASTPIFQRLLMLTTTLLNFRGGPKKLSETITGLCLLKLLTPMISNMNHYAFKREEETHQEDYHLNWKAFKSFVSSETPFEVFDNVQFLPQYGFKRVKDLIKVYSHINQLQSLISVAYSANSEIREDGMIGFNGSYAQLAGEHLDAILTEAGVLEGDIRKFTWIPISTDVQSVEQLNDVQVKFAMEVGLLYLYQTIYHDVPLTSRTILLVKRLLETVELIFDKFEQLSKDQMRGMKVFPLALFTLGVDIAGEQNRAWYKEKIERLYELTQCGNLETMVLFLDKIWEMNPTGDSYVDTRQLAAQVGVTLCLHV